MTTNLSKCCGAEVEYIEDNYGHGFVCTKCDQPCKVEEMSEYEQLHQRFYDLEDLLAYWKDTIERNASATNPRECAESIKLFLSKPITPPTGRLLSAEEIISTLKKHSTVHEDLDIKYIYVHEVDFEEVSKEIQSLTVSEKDREIARYDLLAKKVAFAWGLQKGKEHAAEIAKLQAAHRAKITELLQEIEDEYWGLLGLGEDNQMQLWQTLKSKYRVK